jgi:mannose-6-phosphate isomerase-like protein (cupin superfamily)
MTEDALRLPDGAEYRVVSRPADPEREPLVMEFVLPHDCIAPPPHLHPGGQRETFEVVQGSFELLVGHEWRPLAAGESLVVESGVRHTFRNHSGTTAIVRNVHDPAHSFEAYLRRVVALARRSGGAGPTSPRMMLAFTRLWREHSDTIVPADLPMRVATATMGRLARLLGVSAPPA